MDEPSKGRTTPAREPGHRIDIRITKMTCSQLVLRNEVDCIAE
jgi:hypothetical protein